jgi:hypothetical protein
VPKDEIKGIITKYGDNTGLSGRKFRWFMLSRNANQDSLRVIGFYPQGIGPRCIGLEDVHTGNHVTVSGKNKGDVFFAEKIVKLARVYGKGCGGPPAEAGPWKAEGIVVNYRNGREKDWLEIVTTEGDQVPVTMQPGVLDRKCLGKKFLFTGTANGSGYRHGSEAQALEDA